MLTVSVVLNLTSVLIRQLTFVELGRSSDSEGDVFFIVSFLPLTPAGHALFVFGRQLTGRYALQAFFACSAPTFLTSTTLPSPRNNGNTCSSLLNHLAVFPLLPLFPLRLASLIRFAWWLPHNGVRASWDSVSNYVGSVVLWARSRGHPDIRIGAEVATWELFHDNFGRHVKTVRPDPKIPIRIQHLEAISLDADLGSAVDRADMAAYSLLFFASACVGHFSPKSDSPKGMKHLLRWSNIKFIPDIFEPSLVFILVATSKTALRLDIQLQVGRRGVGHRWDPTIFCWLR